jgi:hypothetical protein
LFARGDLSGHVALSTRLDRDGGAVGGSLALRPDAGLDVELA